MDHPPNYCDCAATWKRMQQLSLEAEAEARAEMLRAEALEKAFISREQHKLARLRAEAASEAADAARAANKAAALAEQLATELAEKQERADLQAERSAAFDAKFMAEKSKREATYEKVRLQAEEARAKQELRTAQMKERAAEFETRRVEEAAAAAAAAKAGAAAFAAGAKAAGTASRKGGSGKESKGGGGMTSDCLIPFIGTGLIFIGVLGCMSRFVCLCTIKHKLKSIIRRICQGVMDACTASGSDAAGDGSGRRNKRGPSPLPSGWAGSRGSCPRFSKNRLAHESERREREPFKYPVISGLHDQIYPEEAEEGVFQTPGPFF